MQRVPRWMHLMASKRVPGRVALSNQRSIELLDSDPLWREHCALIGSAIGQDRRAFLVQPYSHAARIRILQDALEWKEAATAHNRGVDLFVPIPAIHAPMRVKNPGKQFVHPLSPSKRLRVRLSQNGRLNARLASVTVDHHRFNVDQDTQGTTCRGELAVPTRNHASTRWENKAVKGIIVHAVMGHVTFGDVGEVVVALQHAMAVEIEFLHCAVSVD